MPLRKPADEEPAEEFVELPEEEDDGEFVPVEVDGKGPGEDFKVTEIEDPADEDFEAVDLDAAEEAVEEVETAQEDDGFKIESEEEPEAVETAVEEDAVEVAEEAVEVVETAEEEDDAKAAEEAVESVETAPDVNLEAAGEEIEASGDVELEEGAAGEDPAAEESIEEDVELEVVPDRGVAARYKKGSKPMTPAQKRMKAALILSLPVIFIAIVAAGFIIKVEAVDGEVCLWTHQLRGFGLLKKPEVKKSTSPSEAATPAPETNPTETPTPVAAADNPLVKEYDTLLFETKKSIVDHDVLRERMKAKATEAGLEAPDEEIKKAFHDETTAMVTRIKDARARLDELAAEIQKGPPSPVTERSHAKASSDLNRILVNLEIFAGDTRPARKPNEEALTTSVRPKSGTPKPDVEPPPTEPPPTEPKPAEPVPAEPKPAEPKPAEPKPAEPVPAEPKPAEPKPAEPKPAEPKPAEPVPAEPKPAEPKPAEPVPAEPTPAPEEPKPAVEPAPIVEPAPPARNAETLIRDGSRLVVKSSESIMNLMETKIPANASNLLQLRLEAEDALAGLDDAEFKFGRAMTELKAQKDRTEEVKKIEGNLARLRELRQAFIDDFVRKLDRRTGRR